MAGSGVSLTDAGQGGNAAGPRHGRRKLPRAQAILWSPGDATRSAVVARPAGPESYEPFIHRSVISGINRHVDDDEEARFGFLLGHLYRCPDTGIRYSVADTAIAATEEFLEDASGSFLIRAWADAQPVFEGHSGVLLGWYHSHRLLGLSLSGSDEDANERYFGKPWQLSIVVVPDPVRPLGGVFRFDPDAGVAERRKPSPFYELLDDDKAGARTASAVVWTNYDIEKGGPVAEVKAGRFEMATPALERQRSVGATRPVQLVIPGDGGPSGLFPAFRRRAWWPIGVFATVMLFVALLTIARGLDRSPVTTVPQSRTVRTLEERRFFDAVDGLAVALERYAERSTDYEAGRIGCDLLATGYAAADASFVRIAARFGELGPEPAEDAQGAYDTSTTEIAAINTHFDGSGCPRP
jgi:hypothetical protein